MIGRILKLSSHEDAISYEYGPILLKNISIIGAPLNINFKKSIGVIHQGIKTIFELWKTGKIKPAVGQI